MSHTKMQKVSHGGKNFKKIFKLVNHVIYYGGPRCDTCLLRTSGGCLGSLESSIKCNKSDGLKQCLINW